MDNTDLKRFQKKDFAVGEYVETISKKLLVDLREQELRKAPIRTNSSVSQFQTKTELESFDTKPLLALFEGTLKDLRRMHSDLDVEIDNQTLQKNEQEKDYNSKLLRIKKQFEKTMTDYKQLDQRIYQVGNMAVAIGDHLQAVDKQRAKAEELAEVVNYFIELNSGEIRSPIWTDDSMIKSRAELLRKLNNLTNELDRAEAEITGTAHNKEKSKDLIKVVRKTKIGKESVAEQVNKLENSLLNRFLDAQNNRNYDDMKLCAEILTNFNGGASCVSKYITTLRIFFDEKSVQLDNVDINEFFDDLKQICKQEYTIIYRVFPNPADVMQTLSQRIFAQRIETFLDRVLNPIENTGPGLVNFLSKLYTCYTKCEQLVATLKELNVDLNFNSILDSVFGSYKDEYITREMQSLSIIYREQLKILRGEDEEAFEKARNMNYNIQ